VVSNKDGDGAWTSSEQAAIGISLELLVLAGILLLALWVPAGPLFGVYLVVAQLAATYLIHCPAHFIAGTAVGVRFTKLHFGRTTLARVVPDGVKSVARLLPILALSIDRGSLVGISKGRLAAMYASGTIASAGAALVIAVVTALSEPLTYSFAPWTVAVVYLAFDAVFSPRSGDLRRARLALAG